MEEKIYYKRNLPHFQPSNAIYFITFRLSNSLPGNVINELRKENDKAIGMINLISDKIVQEKKLYLQQKKYFGKFDAMLDSSTRGSIWLRNDKVAQMVADSMNYRDEKEYKLYAFCIMPNHVHMLFETSRNSVSSPNGVRTYVATTILKSLKIHTAIEANKILHREGQFWHRESYDHVVRNSREFENVLNYIIQNPVKAGLVKDWKDWKWTYNFRNNLDRNSKRCFEAELSSAM